jgi:hypothetical protein
MYKLLIPATAAALVLAVVTPAQAQDKDAKAIIEKSIKAHGGEKALARLGTSQAKAKGTVKIADQALPFAMESWQHLPNQSRVEIEIDVANMKIKAIEVYDNGKGWNSEDGMTKEADKEQLEDMKFSLYVARLTTLSPLLKDKSLELSLLPEEKVNGKAALGIKVASKDQKDVKIYFDKESYLIVKVSRQALDPVNKGKVTQDDFYSDYKDFDGLKQAMQLVIQMDGKEFINAQFSELTFPKSLPDGTFNKPK